MDNSRIGTRTISRCAAMILQFSLTTTAIAQGTWDPNTGNYELSTPDYRMSIDGSGFRFGFSGFGGAPVPAHSSHGLAFGGSPIQSILSVNNVDGNDVLRVQAANGELGTVTVHALDSAVRFSISPDNAATITTQTGGLANAPAYGLADAAVTGSSTNLAGGTYNATRNDGNLNRFASSFLIHPSRRFAGVSFYPSDTTVTTNNGRYSITSQNTGGAGDFKDVDVYYFVGESTDIYSAYRSARTTQGYPDVAPQSQLFEIGWESWDLLRWNANGETVRDAVQEFLDRDYPIRWVVTGSGFWEPTHTTTSFGFLDQSPGEYPNPTGPIGPNGVGFGTWTEQEGIAWLIGQRTSFITPRTGVVDGYVAGPFTQEADNLGYFVNNLDGTRFENSTSWFPPTPTWILDGSNPAAATWFQQQFELWRAHGVDGVKEDTGATQGLQRTDVFNGPMNALADSGSLIMARDGVFTMPGTLHRINDTFGSFSNRTPINWLQYAASAAPNGYADSIGFGYMNSNPTRAIRNAWVQSLTGGMAFSDSPWNWSQPNQDALRAAVEFRHALTPYIHSAAVDSYETGYPHTMTPLYIAFPDDPNTYNLANTSTDQYQWMVGPSLLAAPFFEGSGNQMDIYLPEGDWIDYHTGSMYSGGQTLTNFAMEIDRPPVFVGGKGILIQRSFDEETLTGEVYPVSPTGTSYTFTHMDGESETTILNDATNWSPTRMRVTNVSLGQAVPFVIDETTGAVRFEILAGQEYQVTSLPTACLKVDRQTGELFIINNSGESIEFDAYTISSASSALDPTNSQWNSLQDQGMPDWRESNPNASRLSELKEVGVTSLPDGESLSLGSAFSGNPTFIDDQSDEDLVFEYVGADGNVIVGAVEYVGQRIDNNLLVTIDPNTGAATLTNNAPFDVAIDGYALFSDVDALDPTGWNSLDDQDAGGGDWRESNPDSGRLVELKESGELILSPGMTINLGILYDTSIGGDLGFEFLLAGELTATNGRVLFEPTDRLPGDYNDDGIVDAADYAVWRDNLGEGAGTLANDIDGGTIGAAQYMTWRRHFGAVASPLVLNSSQVPEPPAWLLVVLGSSRDIYRRIRTASEATILRNEQ